MDPNNNGQLMMTKQSNPMLKSIESRQQVKLLFYNQSNRKVSIIWLDYEGQEKVYFPLGPGCKYVIDSYVTHPFILRDFKNKSLAIFDALVADRRDLMAFHKWNKYNERKRFQVASRILYPIPHNQQTNFLLIIVKNGVYPLQEMCSNTLIEQLKKKGDDDIRYLPFMKNLPFYLCDDLVKNFQEGQSSSEFVDHDSDSPE